MRKLVFVALAALALTASATAATPTITLQASPLVVTYGGATTLSGTVTNPSGNQDVSVLAQECGTTAMKPLATVTPTASGGFTYAAHPRLNTAYEAKYKNATSTTITVKVRPLMSLQRIVRRKFTVSVLAAQSFAGHTVAFQRYAAASGRWITVKRVSLVAGATATTPLPSTTTSAATFRVRIRSHLKVRAVLTQLQAGSCYLAARSNIIRS
jgi:hypothetical protein